MFVTFRKGTCEALLNDQLEHSDNRFVQVVSVEEVDEDSKGRKKYLLEITDGFESIPVMLSMRLNSLVSNGKIAMDSVIQIADHVRWKAQGARIVIIQAIDSLAVAPRISHDIVPLDVYEDPEQALSQVVEYMSSKRLMQDVQQGVPARNEAILVPASTSDTSSQGLTDLGSSDILTAVESAGAGTHYQDIAKDGLELQPRPAH